MSESQELYASVNYIKHKVDAIEKIEFLNLRSNKALQEEYVALLQADELLLRVYKTIDGSKSQKEGFPKDKIDEDTLRGALVLFIRQETRMILGHWRRPVPLMLVSSLPNIRLMVAKAAIGTGLRPFALFSKHIIH